jgi:hypothetical protein
VVRFKAARSPITTQRGEPRCLIFRMMKMRRSTPGYIHFS